MTSAAAHPPNRWIVAVMGTLLQLCLGTVYAWSYFQSLLVKSYRWSYTDTAWAFSLVILTLGISAAWAGVNLPKIGPRKLAMAGGILFSLSYLLGGLALYLGSIPLFYLGYSVVGGIGIGLGYVTPVSTVAKWFPDKRGLVTGVVVMGFGVGAFVMSKVLAPLLPQQHEGGPRPGVRARWACSSASCSFRHLVSPGPAGGACPRRRPRHARPPRRWSRRPATICSRPSSSSCGSCSSSTSRRASR